MTLIECDSNIPHRVVLLEGGARFKLRLENLGLSEGKIITKIFSHPFRGPVTVKIQNTELAIGHGMASRIIVERLHETPDPDRKS